VSTRLATPPIVLLVHTLLVLASPDGSYALAASPAEARHVANQAIDDATETMHFPTRGIARRRLRAKNELARHVEIRSLDDGRVQVRFDGDPERTFASPPDGTPVRVELPDGEVVTLAQRLHGEQLEQRFISKDGERSNVFERLDDGLALTVTFESDRLPRPVTYELRYEATSGRTED
jgi:hypothetical protein